jgi:dTDP-4-dehydrorhamnose 3,5-epimerase-like enzyme
VHLIQFETRGDPAEGYLAIAARQQGVPFEIKRVFWTYLTPQHVTRGRHAHYNTQMVILAVHGRIRLKTESTDGNVQDFLLDRPEQGLYLPPVTWHTMEYSPDAVQLVLASTEYDPGDYIRDYQTFKNLG